jgi:hypothetical protein
LTLVIFAAFLTALAIGINYYFSDQAWWRKLLVGIGFVGILLSSLQAYQSHQHTRGLETESATLRDRLSKAEDRDLNADQLRGISTELRPFAGKKVLVGSFRGDGEAARIGHKILSALHAAGIEIGDSVGYGDPDTNGGGVAFGIHISGPDAEKDFTTALKNAIGAPGRLNVDPEIQNNLISVNGATVHILIGIKPAA